MFEPSETLSRVGQVGLSVCLWHTKLHSTGSTENILIVTHEFPIKTRFGNCGNKRTTL